MFKHNFFTYGGKIIVEILGEILFFPIWWYSIGFVRLVKNVFRFWRNQEKSLGFSVWAKNIFVPMYGQNDFSGRLISFVMRLIQVVFRGFVLLLWLALVLFILIFWLALPFLLLLSLVLQLTHHE